MKATDTSSSIIKKNCLAAVHPELAAQWHPTMNGDLRPEDVTPGSNKRVWWLCEQGHAYLLRIASRASLNQGCPYCAGKRVLTGFNDLQSQFPSIAAQWVSARNAFGPDAYTAHSNRTAYWICEKGHSYRATIVSRTSHAGQGTGCPYCSGRLAYPGVNDLATKRPALLAEWNYEKNAPLLPTEVTEFSMKKVHWKCQLGHEWIATVAGRSVGHNCPICAGKQLLRGYNDLATRFPDVAAEWDHEKNPSKPEDHIAGTHTRAWWVCKQCGNRWNASIKERTFGKTGCPNCTFYHKTSLPEQIIFYYIRQGFEDAVNSYKPPYLSPREIDIYVPQLRLGIEYDGGHWHKDLARDMEKSALLRQHHIALLRLLRVREQGLPPIPEDEIIACPPYRGDTLAFASTIKALFAYINEHYKTSVSPDIDIDRDLLAIKASYEGRKQKSSLLQEDPLILQEWDYEKNGSLTPDKITAHSRITVWWRCSQCGRAWQQSVKTRMHGDLHCETCTKTAENRRRALEKAKSGRSHLLSEYPLLMREWDHEANGTLDPLTLTYGSEKSAWWKCEACGNSFRQVIKNRTVQGQGCPLCGRKRSAQKRSKQP